MKDGVAFADATAAPRGPAERTDHGVVPPPKVDAFTAFIADTLVPALRGRAGYRTLEVVVDRVSGDVRVVTTWADEASRRAAADAFLTVLQHAQEFELRPIAIEEP
jgi:hypothetical protein